MSFRGLLNKFPNAAGAWSLSKLTNTATSVLRGRNGSNNAERDFTATEVSDGTLLSWVGTGGTDNGFVTTLYDQRVPTSKSIMNFDGVDDFVQTGATASSANQTGFTYSFWFFGNDVTSSQAGLVAYNSAAITQFLEIRSSGLIFYIDPTPAVFGITDTNNLVADQWNHCVGVYDAGTMRLYVNGSSEAFTLTGTLSPTETRYNDLTIGARRNLTNVIKGPIDDAIIFSDALSDADVATLYAAGRKADLTVGTGVYRWFNTGNTDADWVDQIGSNDGTVNGNPARLSTIDYTTIARDATQSTLGDQPKIVNSGALVTDGNGNVSTTWDGAGDDLDVLAGFAGLTAANVYAVTDNGGTVTLDTLTSQDISADTNLSTVLSGITYDDVTAVFIYPDATDQAAIQAEIQKLYF